MTILLRLPVRQRGRFHFSIRFRYQTFDVSQFQLSCRDLVAIRCSMIFAGLGDDGANAVTVDDAYDNFIQSLIVRGLGAVFIRSARSSCSFTIVSNAFTYFHSVPPF